MADADRRMRGLTTDAMERHAASRASIETTNQLIEGSREAVKSSKALLERTRAAAALVF